MRKLLLLLLLAGLLAGCRQDDPVDATPVVAGTSEATASGEGTPVAAATTAPTDTPAPPPDR